MDTSIAQSAESSRIHPEYFQLPRKGPDPWFGIGRSSYYEFERLGFIQLVRLKKPGGQRGKVLVPFTAAAQLVRKMSENR